MIGLCVAFWRVSIALQGRSRSEADIMRDDVGAEGNEVTGFKLMEIVT